MKKYIMPRLNIQRFGIESVLTSSAEQFDNWEREHRIAKVINWNDQTTMNKVEGVIKFTD